MTNKQLRFFNKKAFHLGLILQLSTTDQFRPEVVQVDFLCDTWAQSDLMGDRDGVGDYVIIDESCQQKKLLPLRRQTKIYYSCSLSRFSTTLVAAERRGWHSKSLSWNSGLPTQPSLPKSTSVKGCYERLQKLKEWYTVGCVKQLVLHLYLQPLPPVISLLRNSAAIRRSFPPDCWCDNLVLSCLRPNQTDHLYPLVNLVFRLHRLIRKQRFIISWPFFEVPLLFFSGYVRRMISASLSGV